MRMSLYLIQVKWHTINYVVSIQWCFSCWSNILLNTIESIDMIIWHSLCLIWHVTIHQARGFSYYMSTTTRFAFDMIYSSNVRIAYYIDIYPLYVQRVMIQWDHLYLERKLALLSAIFMRLPYLSIQLIVAFIDCIVIGKFNYQSQSHCFVQ